jgi:hypothetical protein
LVVQEFHLRVLSYGKESEVIEMVSQCSFSLFIAITYGCSRIDYSLSADGSESNSEEESSAADDDNCETDCNNSKKSPKFSP